MMNENRLRNAIAYHNANDNENDSHDGEANRVTAKNLKGTSLRAATFEFSGALFLKVLLLCEASVFLRTLLSFHLSCDTVSLFPLSVPPLWP